MVLTSQNVSNLLGTKASFPQIIAWDQALHWTKKEKKIGVGKKKHRRGKRAERQSEEGKWNLKNGKVSWIRNQINGSLNNYLRYTPSHKEPENPSRQTQRVTG